MLAEAYTVFVQGFWWGNMNFRMNESKITEIQNPKFGYLDSLQKAINSLMTKIKQKKKKEKNRRTSGLICFCFCCFVLLLKQMFGREAAKLLDYIECFPDGVREGTKMAEACYDVKLKGFPTWEINGQVRTPLELRKTISIFWFLCLGWFPQGILVSIMSKSLHNENFYYLAALHLVCKLVWYYKSLVCLHEKIIMLLYYRFLIVCCCLYIDILAIAWKQCYLEDVVFDASFAKMTPIVTGFKWREAVPRTC